MELIAVPLNNLFAPLPVNPENERVEIIVHNNNTKIERIISTGQTSPASGWYDQEKDEWVAVLKGAAIISFDDGKEVTLKAGDHITLSAHTKHRVKWTDPDTETQIQNNMGLAVHY